MSVCPSSCLHLLSNYYIDVFLIHLPSQFLIIISNLPKICQGKYKVKKIFSSIQFLCSVHSLAYLFTFWQRALFCILRCLFLSYKCHPYIPDVFNDWMYKADMPLQSMMLMSVFMFITCILTHPPQRRAMNSLC